MDFSIIITSYNRASVLKELLKNLEKQTDPAFEVVVAIDGSTDNTEQMLGELETSYPLKWINTHCKSYGLAVARNRGILAAEGELVAILDDDSFPQPGFVEAHKRVARQQTITGGPRTPAGSDDPRQAWKMQELNKLPACQPVSFDTRRRNWPSAVITECNISLFRQDIIDMGLFSERLKLYGFIGQEFFARAEHFGFTYQYNPDAKMLHYRQIDGDNELTQRKKNRQIKIAEAIRPVLMTPQHFKAQAQWAQGKSSNPPVDVKLPPFKLRASLQFPYRYTRRILAGLRHKLRNKVT
jgi:glycosyltransferase involved in cell wall biosynthesis